MQSLVWDDPGFLAVNAGKKSPEYLRLELARDRGLVWVGEGQTWRHHRARVQASPLQGL